MKMNESTPLQTGQMLRGLPLVAEGSTRPLTDHDRIFSSVLNLSSNTTFDFKS